MSFTIDILVGDMHLLAMQRPEVIVSLDSSAYGFIRVLDESFSIVPIPDFMRRSVPGRLATRLSCCISLDQGQVIRWRQWCLSKELEERADNEVREGTMSTTDHSVHSYRLLVGLLEVVEDWAVLLSSNDSLAVQVISISSKHLWRAIQNNAKPNGVIVFVPRSESA